VFLFLFWRGGGGWLVTIPWLYCDIVPLMLANDSKC